MKKILKNLVSYLFSLFNGSRRSNILRFLVLFLFLILNIVYTNYTDNILKRKIEELKEEISRPAHSARVENEDLVRQELISLAQRCGTNSCVSKLSIKKVDEDNYFLYFFDVICYDQNNDEYRSYMTSQKSNSMYHSWSSIDKNSQIFTLSLKERVTKINREYANTMGLILYQRIFYSFDKIFPIRDLYIAPWYYKENLDWILIVSYKKRSQKSECEFSPELLYSANNKIEKYWRTNKER
jgi:hypothetical protein